MFGRNTLLRTLSCKLISCLSRLLSHDLVVAIMLACEGVCDRVVNTSTSGSGGPGFKPRPLRCFLRQLACERQTFLLAHRRWGTFREEERLRLSDRNSILMTQINVYIINPVVMGFQIQICPILRVFWSILVKCCVHLPTSSSKTQMLLLEKTIFHKYWLFC